MRATLLLSYFFWRTLDLDKALSRFEERPLVFADSGGFSAASIGATIDLEDYARWCERWKDWLDIVCTLDVVGDAEATALNTARLEDHGLPVWPVFHVAEPWEALDAMLERHRTICIGGMVPFSHQPTKVLRWIVECMRRARDAGVVVHGLGQTNWRNIYALPFFSADSSSWAVADRWGGTHLWDAQRHRLLQLDAGRPITGPMRQLLRDQGLDPDELGKQWYGRGIRAAGRPVDEVRQERHTLRAASLRAWLQLQSWWQGRFSVDAPPEAQLPTGPHLFFVAINPEQVECVRSVVHGDGTLTHDFTNDRKDTPDGAPAPSP